MSSTTATKTLLMLDALFDTRLGTLNILVPDEVCKMSPAEYVRRTRDDFNHMSVDNELFKHAYSRRDHVTLTNSIITNIVPVVQNSIHQYVALVNPIRRGVIELDLNFYPYRLKAAEKDMFCALLEHKLGGVVKVNPIELPYASMTLSTLSSQYHTVFIYDWVDWAIAIEASFRTEHAPTLTVVVPDILSGESMDNITDDKTKAAFAVAHPTAYMEFALADYVGLSFESVEFFSFLH